MRLAALALVLALAVGGWFAAGAVGQNLREQGAVSVRNAILDSAKQCCACLLYTSRTRSRTRAG